MKTAYASSNQEEEQSKEPPKILEYTITHDYVSNTLRTEFEPMTPTQKSYCGKEDLAKYDFAQKTRAEHLKALQSGEEYDILIIGGGANGAGVVLDAASRGLKCAVIDQYDFAGNTSSKSTKMAHGGIRYFQQMCYLQGNPIESF